MDKVLTVDIGNSNIVVGVWYNSVLRDTGRFVTKRDYSEKELAARLYEITGSENEYSGAILSSVVPEITDITLKALDKITRKEPLLMGPFLSTGIDISDYDEGRLGTDRIVDLAAAVSMCQDRPVMVCDLGTCTTISVADCGGRLIGGMICPGVQLSLDAEAKRASQLPKLVAMEAESILGRNTASNMNSGAVVATGFMISKAAEQIAKEYELDNMAIVITGGLGKLIMPWVSVDAIYEPNLLLKGLHAIYSMNLEGVKQVC